MALERMARSSVLPHRKVVQATALLGFADGWSVRSIDRLLRTYPSIFPAAWRDRFLEPGVDAVGAIASGCGRKTAAAEAIVEQPSAWHSQSALRLDRQLHTEHTATRRDRVHDCDRSRF